MERKISYSATWRNKKELTELIKKEAIKLGFDLFGVTSALPQKRAARRFKKWLEKGNEAGMAYMSRSLEKRADPKRILPGAKSVICLAVNYFQKRPSCEGEGKIATYAAGRDYHKVLTCMLKKLDSFIKSLVPCIRTRFYVDTGPFLERTFAERAGLGFIGRNSCLITREFGSWVFLAEIITDLRLAPSPKPAWKARCGACTRCMDACPNKAIAAPGVVDAQKCISYLTIENKNAIPAGLTTQGWIFGCDICQQVCPHNSRARLTKSRDFLRHIAGFQRTRKEILAIKTDKQFLEKFAGSPLMRAKLKGLRRNVRREKTQSS